MISPWYTPHFPTSLGLQPWIAPWRDPFGQDYAACRLIDSCRIANAFKDRRVVLVLGVPRQRGSAVGGFDGGVGGKRRQNS
jgi:hypothetical protein